MSAPTGFKRLGVVLGALAGAIVIMLAVASYLITAESASQAVQAEIKAATGFEPSVRGPVSLSVFPSPRVLLSDVAMAGPEGGDPPLTAERMVVHVRWLPLLVGRFDIADVALDRPQIAVKIDRQGRFNWSPLIDALARTVRAGGPPEAQTLSFSEIRIANGVITVEDAVRDTAERLDKVELSLAWPSIAKGFAATGRVAWRDESLGLGLTIADFMAALSGDVSGVKLRVAGPPGKLAFDGSISYLPSLKIDGTLAIDAPSLRSAMAWAASKPLPGAGLGRLSLKARTNVVGGTIALSNLNIELDGNVAEGVLSYAMRDRRALQGTLAVDTLDLTPYLSAVRLLAAGARGWSERPITLDWFDDIDFDLRVSAARVIAAQSRIGRTAAAASLRNSRLVITVGEAEGFNGMINGSLAIAKTDDGAHLRSQVQFADVDLESSLADMFGFRRLEGKGDLSLDIDAHGRSVMALAKTMSGSATLAAREVALTGVNVEQLLRRLERRPLAGSSDFRNGRTPFETLNLALRIAQGTANLEDGRFESGNVRVALAGSASIPARDFDLNGTASLLAGNEAPPAFELPFFVQGTWDDPIMLPDTQALIRRSGAAAPLLNAVTDKRARDEVRSAIDRMMREGSAPGRRREETMPIPFEPAPKAETPVDEAVSR